MIAGICCIYVDDMLLLPKQIFAWHHCATYQNILAVWGTAMINEAGAGPVAMVVAPTTEHMTAPMQKANPDAACKTCVCSATLILAFDDSCFQSSDTWPAGCVH